MRHIECAAYRSGMPSRPNPARESYDRWLKAERALVATKRTCEHCKKNRSEEMVAIGGERRAVCKACSKSKPWEPKPSAAQLQRERIAAAQRAREEYRNAPREMRIAAMQKALAGDGR